MRKATISFVMSVCPYDRMEQLGSYCTDFHEIWYWRIFFESLSWQFNFHSCPTWITGSLHEHVCTFMIISRWNLLRVSNVSHKTFKGNQNPHFTFSDFFFPPENFAVYEMWKNTVEPDWPQIIIWRTRIAGWIPKATNRHAEYAILLFHGNNGYMNASECYVNCLSSYNIVVNLTHFVHLLV